MANRRQFIADALIASGVAAVNSYTSAASLFLKANEPLLEDWRFLDYAGGGILLPLLNAAGLPTTSCGCYLLQGTGRWQKCIAIKFSTLEMETARPEVLIAKVQEAIKNRKALTIDTDGGTLPEPL